MSKTALTVAILHTAFEALRPQGEGRAKSASDYKAHRQGLGDPVGGRLSVRNKFGPISSKLTSEMGIFNNRREMPSKQLVQS
jgi:hypothetical protein